MTYVVKLWSSKYDRIDMASLEYQSQLYYYIAFFATFWFVVYSWIYYKFFEKSGMWRSCISGIIHSLFVISCGIFLYFQNNFSAFSQASDMLELNSYQEFMIKICIMSMTWFVIDSIYCIIYDIELFVTIPHHISSAYALYHGLTTNLYFNEIFFLLFIMEVSNPLMCVNAILKLDNKTDTWIFAIVERLHEVSFIVMRVFIGGWFTYAIFTRLKDVHWSIVLALGYVHLFTILVLLMLVSNIYKRDVQGMRRYLKNEAKIE